MFAVFMFWLWLELLESAYSRAHFLSYELPPEHIFFAELRNIFAKLHNSNLTVAIANIKVHF